MTAPPSGWPALPRLPRGLPREVHVGCVLLRFGAMILGFDFQARAWDELARRIGAPASSTMARLCGCGSFPAAKQLAGVGPRVREQAPGFKSRHVKWRDEDDLLGGVLLAVRLLGGVWPSSDDWDRLIRPLRDQGFRVPYINQIYRVLKCSWKEVRYRATTLAQKNGWVLPRLTTKLADREAEIVERMAFAEDALGWRPNSHEWNRATRHLRESGVPTTSCITRYFKWLAAWQRVDELRRQREHG